jgi:hypothetical protein
MNGLEQIYYRFPDPLADSTTAIGSTQTRQLQKQRRGKDPPDAYGVESFGPSAPESFWILHTPSSVDPFRP